MADAQNQQQPLMDDTTFGTNFELPYMDEDPSDDVCNSRGELTIAQCRRQAPVFIPDTDNYNIYQSRVAEELQPAVDAFIAGWRQHIKNITGREFSADDENDIRRVLAVWYTFLQRQQGEQFTEDNKKWIIMCLQRWNMFLQARAGETLVTRCGMFFTVIGLFFYLLDQVSDIGTAIYYVYMEQWWQAIVILVIVYGTIIIYTAMKWVLDEIHCTGTADWLRYISTLLVNWPEVKQCGVLCLLQWKLYKSPAKYAHLVPEWHQRRARVVFLKYVEGMCEACPQAILQLCLLLPDLYGDLTWTDYLRTGSVCISLCTAGAALTNLIKPYRISNYIDVPTCELVVLHVWAVPVTVSRLLSVALLLTVEPYWGLAGVALHVIVNSVYWCSARGVLRALDDVLTTCLATLWSFISPFGIAESITYRRVLHAIHFLGNTVATVVWALGTPLACSHPALYTAIICFNAVMFVLGLVGWALHEKYWPDSYFKRNYYTGYIVISIQRNGELAHFF